MKKFSALLSAILITITAAGGINSYAAPKETAKPSPAATETSPSPEATPEESLLPEATPEVSSSPETTPTASPETASAAPKHTSNTLDFHIVINKKKFVKDSFIKVEVYDKNNNLLGSDRQWVGGITKTVDLHYDLPEYELGETFTVKLADGANSLAYYDKKISVGETFEIKTSFYTNKNGEFVSGNKFNFNAVPNWEKEVIVYVEDNQLTLKPRARIVNNTTLVPVREVAEAMHLDVNYDKEYDSVTCSIGGKEIIYNMNDTYATFFGKDTYLTYPASYIQGAAYVPVRSLTDAFDAPLKALDFGDHMDIVIGRSGKVEEYMKDIPVNKNGISSRTQYLVWVSKSEYKVRVYKGSQYNWSPVYTATCAIGAPGTPTVTGSFEYIERTQWNYNGYYVGPVLRFYNGYALHSTLLYYGGGEYDGRVGVQISHGCIRLHPADINWIAARIPFGTRIYITE